MHTREEDDLHVDCKGRPCGSETNQKLWYTLVISQCTLQILLFQGSAHAGLRAFDLIRPLESCQDMTSLFCQSVREDHDCSIRTKVDLKDPPLK